MEDLQQLEADTIDSEELDTADEAQTEAPRDYEAEARRHGWLPPPEFKGDLSKWVDAETFVKRADEVMPFLKKQNAALKREMEDLKKQVKQASAFFSKAEERAYQRALADLEARHDEAVETGDLVAARKVMREMGELQADKPEPIDDKPAFDQEAAQRELNDWIERNDWYVTDDARRRYADFQAGQMGPATDWPEGNKAWLDELERRVERKFAERKPQAVAAVPARAGAAKGGKSFADLPPEAKRACDKFVAKGIIANREAYVKAYDWSA